MPGTVSRIEVVAQQEEDPREELDRVRREADAGDASWRQWLEEYESGAAMLLRLEVSITIKRDGASERLTRTNRNVWVADHAHPPKVERQVADLAHKDFESLARELREREVEVGVPDLEEMLVAVTLRDDVLDRLSGEHRHLGDAPASRPGLTTNG
jgi:hypothetical protein